MARVVGVEIPNEKRAVVALTYIHGIGKKTAQTILKATNIDESKRVKDFTNEDLKKVYEYIDKNIPVEGQVKQQIFRNIKRLRDIRCFRGIRHRLGLPVRGQNTRANCRTRKGKSVAVGGLKNKAAAH